MDIEKIVPAPINENFTRERCGRQAAPTFSSFSTAAVTVLAPGKAQRKQDLSQRELVTTELASRPRAVAGGREVRTLRGL